MHWGHPLPADNTVFCFKGCHARIMNMAYYTSNFRLFWINMDCRRKPALTGELRCSLVPFWNLKRNKKDRYGRDSIQTSHGIKMVKVWSSEANVWSTSVHPQIEGVIGLATCRRRVLDHNEGEFKGLSREMNIKDRATTRQTDFRKEVELEGNMPLKGRKSQWNLRPLGSPEPCRL